jgi:hypothetical protein
MTVPHTATRSDVDDPEDTEKKSAQQERDIEDIRGNLGDLLLELVPKASHVGAARFDTGPPHDCSRTWYRCHCRCRGRHWVALPKRRAADDASRPPLASGICAAAHDACTRQSLQNTIERRRADSPRGFDSRLGLGGTTTHQAVLESIELAH